MWKVPFTLDLTLQTSNLGKNWKLHIPSQGKMKHIAKWMLVIVKNHWWWETSKRKQQCKEFNRMKVLVSKQCQLTKRMNLSKKHLLEESKSRKILVFWKYKQNKVWEEHSVKDVEKKTSEWRNYKSWFIRKTTK